MRILITGGAGFIGSHLADAYIAKGHQVAVLDDLSTGSRRNLNRKARFYRADVRDLAAVEKIVAKEQPQVLSHHAAIMEVVKSVRDPLATFDVNVRGTLNALTAFGERSRARKRTFIFASSGGAAYGDPSGVPVGEDAPLAPLSPYGLSKKLCEELVRFKARWFGFGYFNLRYGNVFGPRQNPHGEAGVVAIFGGLVGQGRRPTIFGDGSKVRDYIYIDDIVGANLKLLRRAGSADLNLGRGRGVTDRQVFEAIARHFGYTGKPIYSPRRRGEVKRIVLDVKKAGRMLGWKPQVAFAEGIRRTMDALTNHERAAS